MAINNTKVLHIVAGAGTGGAETFCLDAIKALHDAGIRQHVICRAHAHYLDAFEERGISYQTMRFGFFEKFGIGQALIKSAVAGFRPDVVQAWMGRAASFVPKLPVPVLGWFGGYYDLKRYKNADFYAGVTRDIARHIAEASGKPERSFVLHTFGTLDDQPAVERKSLDTPEGAPVVLLLSRMHWKKGIDTLLQAAVKLPGVYFWLAGDGPDLQKYKDMAQAFNLNDRVRFLGWRNDRAGLLKSATVCTLPSRYEPFGTVIAESWYAGVPLVAARAAGASQYVTHDSDGLLCDIDDVDGLALQLNRAITDQGLRQNLIENGRKTYESLFSREVATQAIIDVYQKCIAMGKK
jgi:glycosyltransferase involved in cell wall biosynthesis